MEETIIVGSNFFFLIGLITRIRIVGGNGYEDGVRTFSNVTSKKKQRDIQFSTNPTRKKK